MKKMTLVEQGVLERLRQKQLSQAIQQPELSSMVNIKAHIEDMLNNSTLSDEEKLQLLERAQERYGKLKVMMPPARAAAAEAIAPANAVAAPTAAEGDVATGTMLDASMLPTQYAKKFARFQKFVGNNPTLISKNAQNEMIVEGKILTGSNFDDLIRNLYLPNKKLNVTGSDQLTSALSKASLSPSIVSNRDIKEGLSTPKRGSSSSTFQTPAKGSPKTSDSPEPHKRIRGDTPSIPPLKFTLPFAKSSSSTSQHGNGSRPPGKHPRILKLYH